MSRRAHDLEDALSWGLAEDEAVAYVERVASFHRNTARLTALGSMAGVDTAAALLERIEQLTERVDHLESIVDHPAVVAYLDAIAGEVAL